MIVSGIDRADPLANCVPMSWMPVASKTIEYRAFAGAEEVVPDGRVHRAVYDGSGRVLLERVDGGPPAVYDLRTDPEQRNPLPATMPEAAPLHALRAAVTAQAPVPPGPVLVPDAAFLERLRALGYAR